MSVFIIIFNAADAALDPVVVAGIIGGLQKTYNKKESNRPPCRFSFLQDRLVARKQKKGETLITPERFQLGKNINRLRTTKNLTQQLLADQVQISRRFLQRIEKGAANPGIDVLSRIRKGLKCSWNELADGI